MTYSEKEATQHILLNKINTDEEDKIDWKPVERAQWSNKAEFLLACIGYAVGLGNIWRFSYLAQENGGGIIILCHFSTLFYTFFVYSCKEMMQSISYC